MAEILKAIIVDDEEGARIMLEASLQEYCPNVEVLTMCSNVPDAVLAINKYEPDVVFLDIEMPEYNGFELINFFKQIEFDIVFVTAYSQYAIKAFEVSAIDYLLKPLEIESLQKAVEKVLQKKNLQSMQEQLMLMRSVYGGEEIKKIALPLSDGLSFIDTADIVLFEAERAYTMVFLKDKQKHLISKPMRVFEDMLSNHPMFFRPHRSHLINIQHIKRYIRRDSMIELSNGSMIPVARNRKAEFDSILKSLNLVL